MAAHLIISFLAVFMLACLPASAKAQEPLQVTASDMVEIFLANPDLAQKLDDAMLTSLSEAKKKMLEDNVYQYDFLFYRNGEVAVPVYARVSVFQDLRPMTYDGFPQYKTTIEMLKDCKIH